MDIPEGGSFLDNLSDKSLERLRGAKGEPALAALEPGTSVQFERLGYFCVDTDSKPGALIFNRSVSLRDSWAKIAKKSM
jgi:glutaminyl-tRNA synthetase